MVWENNFIIFEDNSMVIMSYREDNSVCSEKVLKRRLLLSPYVSGQLNFLGVVTGAGIYILTLLFGPHKLLPAKSWKKIEN